MYIWAHAHFLTSLYTAIHACLSVCIHFCVCVCVSSQAGSETGQTAPIALLDESRASAKVSTGSLGEILDIITASGCVGSGLGIMCLLVCLSNCLQSGQWALDSSFRVAKFYFDFFCSFLRLSLSTSFREVRCGLSL